MLAVQLCDTLCHKESLFGTNLLTRFLARTTCSCLGLRLSSKVLTSRTPIMLLPLAGACPPPQQGTYYCCRADQVNHHFSMQAMKQPGVAVANAESGILVAKPSKASFNSGGSVECQAPHNLAVGAHQVGTSCRQHKAPGQVAVGPIT